VFTVEGVTPNSTRTTSAHIQSIARDYFATFGIPMRAGRELTAADASMSARVAIVNETFVARHIPDGRAIGRRIQMDGQSWEIVGVSRAGRRREIGIRVALGATRASVLRLVMLQGFYQVAVGLVAGVALAALVMRQIQSWLFATSTTDPAIISAAVALLTAAAFLASWGPRVGRRRSIH